MNRSLRVPLSCVAGLALAVLSIRATGAGATVPTLAAKDFAELSAMEEVAEKARHLYWAGRYAEAVTVLDPLCEGLHASSHLYLAERALCLLAAGREAEARRDLVDAAQMSEFFRDERSEKKAQSKFGKEGEKLYRGDPYERATGYLLLALLFMDSGDYDNALAACKSGLLSDSDATENRYESDFTLLYLAQAKCHLLRDEPDAAAQCYQVARRSYGQTHPTVRDLVSERSEKADYLRMTKKERKKAGCTDDEPTLKRRVEELEVAIADAMGHVEIDSDLAISGTGDYNTLIILPRGRVPFKRHGGREANVVVFDVAEGAGERVRFTLDGQPVEGGPLDQLADLGFQSTTRGGRKMESILRGQVNFKRTTVNIGASLTEAGSQAGGLGGLAVALIGAGIQGLGGAVSPDADLRCWKTLPGDFEIRALKLPPGEHRIRFEQYLYFEKRNTLEKTFRLENEKDMAIVFGPPSLMEAYSAQSLEARQADRLRAPRAEPPSGDALPVLLPPPLGMQMIESFPSDDPIRYPRNVAPDPRRMKRLAEAACAKADLHGITLDHDEILGQREEVSAKARWALQIELADLALNVAGQQETYKTSFHFYWVDVATGEAVIRGDEQGSYVSDTRKTSECTAAFYAAFEQCLATFLEREDLKKLLAKPEKELEQASLHQ